MPLQQRQIVEVPFNLTQGVKVHPAIILSTNEAIEFEYSFIAVMMTSVNHDDEYTFEISNEMLSSGKLGKPYSEVRLHLISYFRVSDVIVNNHRHTFVKEADFNRIVKRIMRITFNVYP